MILSDGTRDTELNSPTHAITPHVASSSLSSSTSSASLSSSSTSATRPLPHMRTSPQIGRRSIAPSTLTTPVSLSQSSTLPLTDSRSNRSVNHLPHALSRSASHLQHCLSCQTEEAWLQQQQQNKSRSAPGTRPITSAGADDRLSFRPLDASFDLRPRMLSLNNGSTSPTQPLHTLNRISPTPSPHRHKHNNNSNNTSDVRSSNRSAVNDDRVSPSRRDKVFTNAYSQLPGSSSTLISTTVSSSSSASRGVINKLTPSRHMKPRSSRLVEEEKERDTTDEKRNDDTTIIVTPATATTAPRSGLQLLPIAASTSSVSLSSSSSVSYTPPRHKGSSVARARAHAITASAPRLTLSRSKPHLISTPASNHNNNLHTTSSQSMSRSKSQAILLSKGSNSNSDQTNDNGTAVPRHLLSSLLGLPSSPSSVPVWDVTGPPLPEPSASAIPLPPPSSSSTASTLSSSTTNEDTDAFSRVQAAMHALEIDGHHRQQQYHQQNTTNKNNNQNTSGSSKDANDASTAPQVQGHRARVTDHLSSKPSKPNSNIHTPSSSLSSTMTTSTKKTVATGSGNDDTIHQQYQQHALHHNQSHQHHDSGNHDGHHSHVTMTTAAAIAHAMAEASAAAAAANAAAAAAGANEEEDGPDLEGLPGGPPPLPELVAEDIDVYLRGGHDLLYHDHHHHHNAPNNSTGDMSRLRLARAADVGMCDPSEPTFRSVVPSIDLAPAFATLLIPTPRRQSERDQQQAQQHHQIHIDESHGDDIDDFGVVSGTEYPHMPHAQPLLRSSASFDQMPGLPHGGGRTNSSMGGYYGAMSPELDPNAPVHSYEFHPGASPPQGSSYAPRAASQLSLYGPTAHDHPGHGSMDLDHSPANATTSQSHHHWDARIDPRLRTGLAAIRSESVASSVTNSPLPGIHPHGVGGVGASHGVDAHRIVGLHGRPSLNYHQQPGLRLRRSITGVSHSNHATAAAQATAAAASVAGSSPAPPSASSLATASMIYGTNHVTRSLAGTPLPSRAMSSLAYRQHNANTNSAGATPSSTNSSNSNTNNAAAANNTSISLTSIDDVSGHGSSGNVDHNDELERQRQAVRRERHDKAAAKLALAKKIHNRAHSSMAL
jgi:hypothetical protein